MNDQALLNAWAEDVVRLELRVADLEADRDAYRDIAQTALTAVQALTIERDRQRLQLTELRNELRALRSDSAQAA